jgi:hypothetical protein
MMPLGAMTGKLGEFGVMTLYAGGKGSWVKVLAVLLLLNYVNGYTGAVAGKVAAVSKQASQATGKVLEPEKFKLPVKLGYQAAQAYPQVMRQVFCYCGCDRTDKHTCLLDCFTSVHGAYCAICQEEAIEAAACQRKGVSLAGTQRQIERHYAKRYPFAQPSATLSKYRAQCCR